MDINKITRNFFIGSEWLYFKFYMNEHVSDRFLIDILSPLVQDFFEKNLIKKWFFIRYNDPNSHLRIRFHLKDIKFISEISIAIHNSLENYLKYGFVYKIQIDTYKREIERYGIQTIELCEQIFYLNSELNLSLIKEYENTDERFLFGIKFVDQFLNDFGYNLYEKKEIINVLKKGFAEEFNADKRINQSLSNKYRNLKDKIYNCIENDDDSFDKILKKHRNDFQVVEKKIKKISSSLYRATINNIIDSLLHMHCNRLFNTKQRAHEWVVYDLLFRHYEGKIGRLKYFKNIGES